MPRNRSRSRSKYSSSRFSQNKRRSSRSRDRKSKSVRDKKDRSPSYSKRRRYSSSDSRSDSPHRSYKSNKGKVDRKGRRSSSSSSSMDRKKKNPVKQEIRKAAEPEVKQIVFDSINLLHDIDKKVALDDLEADCYVPKNFASEKDKKTELEEQKPVPEVKVSTFDDTFLHPSLFGEDDEVRLDKWVKKLYLFRQKANNGEI